MSPSAKSIKIPLLSIKKESRRRAQEVVGLETSSEFEPPIFSIPLRRYRLVFGVNRVTCCGGESGSELEISPLRPRSSRPARNP
ncbi:hypothetical protein PIB30_027463 [Stylosanthes scabra]|uniref:Uncharacterized protein n=1 Tax=Stylosanthes scabra TaxID=79078 RepID=A0ABU6Z7H2_9FABA|nr:hypothetical protein [Stylosanthes scabra]